MNNVTDHTPVIDWTGYGEEQAASGCNCHADVEREAATTGNSG